MRPQQRKQAQRLQKEFLHTQKKINKSNYKLCLGRLLNDGQPALILKEESTEEEEEEEEEEEVACLNVS